MTMLPTRSEQAVTWALRAIVMVTAVGHVALGDVIYGVYCLAGLAISLVPAYLARSTRAIWPVDVEVVFLWFLLSDATLGNLGGMYRLAWYDKALHVASAILVAMVAFYAVYLAHLLGRTARHPWIDGVAILLITLGLGAVWEIGEYTVDSVLQRSTQGSPIQAALDDTMWDLILDGIGGVIGAVLGPLYMSRSARSRQRLEAFASLVAARDERRRSRPPVRPAVLAVHPGYDARSARG
jgi:hypothetical protein